MFSFQQTVPFVHLTNPSLSLLSNNRFGGGFGGRDYRYNNSGGYFQKNSNFNKMGSRPMGGGYGQSSSYYPPAQQNGYPERNQYANGGQAGGYANGGGGAGYQQQQMNGYGQRSTDWWAGN